MREGLRPAVRNLYVDGDAVIIFFEASGIGADGEAYANTYARFWEMHDGRGLRAHTFFDSIAFNELGSGCRCGTVRSRHDRQRSRECRVGAPCARR